MPWLIRCFEFLPNFYLMQHKGSKLRGNVAKYIFFPFSLLWGNYDALYSTRIFWSPVSLPTPMKYTSWDFTSWSSPCVSLLRRGAYFTAFKQKDSLNPSFTHHSSDHCHHTITVLHSLDVLDIILTFVICRKALLRERTRSHPTLIVVCLENSSSELLSQTVSHSRVSRRTVAQ